MIREIIAGCEILILKESGIIVRNSHPVAGNFYLKHEKIPAIYNQICLHVCDDPSPVEMGHNLFHANASWSFYEDGSFKWIVTHHPGLDHPVCNVRFNHGFTDGIVYCSQYMMNRSGNRTVVNNPVTYPLDQILMMNFLALHQGMLVHAAGWRVNDAGWMFAGKSGAGKSTISNLIVEHTGAEFLSDDRMIVRKIKDDFLMYGTPWPGDAGYAVNDSAPLKGIFFLSKGEKNSIRKLGPSDAIARLMPVASIPWYDCEKVELMMGFCDALIGAIPMYELTFVPDKKAVDMLLGFVNV